MADVKGGYTLNQLLEWCALDRLIEGYDVAEGSVVIFENGKRTEFDRSGAHAYLRGIFTATQRGSSTDDPNLA